MNYLIFSYLSAVRADLPVHCLRHQITGLWEFTLGPKTPKRSSCGHANPDRQGDQPGNGVLTFSDYPEGKLTKKQIRLGMPNQASTDFDPNGSFTMIYDEGFEVVVDGLSFFAFSRFDLDAYGQNTTHCDETLTGW